MTDDRQSRRQFCAHMCGAASLAALGSILQGCGGSGGNPSGPSNVGALPVIDVTVSNRTIALTIDASSPLAAVGSAALLQGGGNTNLLVARTGDSSFTALTALCTHQACWITGFGNQTYVCPCHGSQYTTSGRVVSGPAPRDLAQFQTQFSGNVLTISL